MDLSAAAASVRSIIDKGPSSSLLFAFEVRAKKCDCDKYEVVAYVGFVVISFDLFVFFLFVLSYLFFGVWFSFVPTSLRILILPFSLLFSSFFWIQYGILAMTMITTLCKYVLHVVELSHAHQARLQRQSERQQQTTEGQQQQAEGSEARPEEHEEELEVERGITWEAKGFWNFLVEIVSSFVMMVLYILFFLVILHYYGMPIHIIRVSLV